VSFCFSISFIVGGDLFSRRDSKLTTLRPLFLLFSDTRVQKGSMLDQSAKPTSSASRSFFPPFFSSFVSNSKLTSLSLSLSLPSQIHHQRLLLLLRQWTSRSLGRR